MIVPKYSYIYTHYTFGIRAIHSQASQDDHILQLTNYCAYSLAKACEIMDGSGIILSMEEAADTQFQFEGSSPLIPKDYPGKPPT